MLAQIEHLCELHKGDKGIIHSANFKIAEWLVDNLKTTHAIMHHNPDSGDDRNSVIDAFIKSKKPTLSRPQNPYLERPRMRGRWLTGTLMTS